MKAPDKPLTHYSLLVGIYRDQNKLIPPEYEELNEADLLIAYKFTGTSTEADCPYLLNHTIYFVFAICLLLQGLSTPTLSYANGNSPD